MYLSLDVIDEILKTVTFFCACNFRVFYRETELLRKLYVAKYNVDQEILLLTSGMSSYMSDYALIAGIIIMFWFIE